ncbi:MAG: hypothetical protein WCJ30_18075, partial [Deltaproteobacteria bacterium]
IAAGAGTEYDPVLVRVFVNAMGMYPPGSLLELDDKRWVVSVSGARSPETFDRPLCALIGKSTRSDGDAKPETVDLALGHGGVRVRG